MPRSAQELQRQGPGRKLKQTEGRIGGEFLQVDVYRKNPSENTQWFNRGSAEGSCDKTKANILGRAQDMDKGLLRWGGPPELGAIRQCGQHNGMIKEAPISHVEPPDAVAKNFDGPKAGARAVGHDLYMVSPIQLVLNVEAEVPHDG